MKENARFYLLLLSLIVSSCSRPADEGSRQDGADTPADGETSVSVTVWTDDIELFMEYPSLKVGIPAKFLVHLTKLSDFRPVAQGPVTFRFVTDQRPAKMIVVDSPTVPGIFGPTVTFEETGEYTFELDISSNEIKTSLRYGPVVVSRGDGEFAPPEQDPGQTISYLKEQQWKLPFASEEVDIREIHETVRIPAEIVPKSGTESILVAPIGGRYERPERRMPDLGTRIEEGDLLGYVELLPADRSDLLNSQVSAGITLSRLSEDVARAEASVVAEQSRLRLVEKEAERVETLVEAEALPRKRLDEVQSELETRRASLKAAEQALATYQKALSRYDAAGRTLGAIEERVAIHAPISGQLVGSSAIPGQYVDSGEMLFRIVNLERVWAQGSIFEQDLHRAQSFVGGSIELPGLEKISLKPTSLVMIGSVLDASARTLPIVLEVENQGDLIKLGSLGRLDLVTSQTVESLAAPRPALLLEENRTVVYVQLEGETFERRMIQTGLEDRNWVQVIEGLDRGERIVTVGAYDVALAGRSTEVPVHGHVH